MKALSFIKFSILVSFFICVLAGSSVAGQSIRWKMASLAPKGIGWSKQVEGILGSLLEKTTDGNLQMKWYWGGIMGDDEDYIKKMRIGQLQGMGFSGQGIVIACPEMAVVELPFLFRNYNEVEHVKKALRPALDSLIKKRGYYLLFWIDQDFDQLYSTKWPFTSLDQFRKAKFITWYGPVEGRFLKRLGASPVPVNVPEVSTSVRQGIADSMIAPAIWMVGAQLYSVVKYVNPVRIRYSPAGLLLTKQSWEWLPRNYQQRFLEERENFEEILCMNVRMDNAKSLQAMVKYGVKEISMPAETLDALTQTAEGLWSQLAGKLYPRELLDQTLTELALYRAGTEK